MEATDVSEASLQEGHPWGASVIVVRPKRLIKPNGSGTRSNLHFANALHLPLPARVQPRPSSLQTGTFLHHYHHLRCYADCALNASAAMQPTTPCAALHRTRRAAWQLPHLGNFCPSCPMLLFHPLHLRRTCHIGQLKTTTPPAVPPASNCKPHLAAFSQTLDEQRARAPFKRARVPATYHADIARSGPRPQVQRLQQSRRAHESACLLPTCCGRHTNLLREQRL